MTWPLRKTYFSHARMECLRTTHVAIICIICCPTWWVLYGSQKGMKRSQTHSKIFCGEFVGMLGSVGEVLLSISSCTPSSTPCPNEGT